MKRFSITNERYQKFNLSIRGEEFSLVIYYINYSNAWFMDITTNGGASIVKGEKMVSGVDLGFKFPTKGVFIADENGNAKDPDGTNWDGLYLYALDEDELESTARKTVLEPTYLIDSNSNPLVDSSGFYLTV